MDHNLTKQIQTWLDTPLADRDNAQGALYLLQLSNNQIMYRNIMINPARKAEFIEYQLRKYMKFRLQDLTHQEVEDMQRQVDKIAIEHNLAYDDSSDDSSSTNEVATTPSDSSEGAAFRSGKRLDHDTLPSDIQSLYVENATIMKKMRELHLRLRLLSTENATCPDSERYPFLQELIKLDKQYHHNWQVYDSYKVGDASGETASADAEQSLVDDARMQQKKIYRQINLAKGRYKKNPSDKLKAQLAELYSQLASPTETLTAEFKELGIIE